MHLCKYYALKSIFTIAKRLQLKSYMQIANMSLPQNMEILAFSCVTLPTVEILSGKNELAWVSNV